MLTTAGAGGINNNAALVSINLPALATVSSDLKIAQNNSLATLSLPALTTVGQQLLVADNPQLRQCVVDAIKLGLASMGSFFAMNNNGTPNTCP